jgi:hypothetical protein
MTSRAGRIGILVAAIAVAVALFVVLQDDGGDDGDGGETTVTQAETSTAPAPPPEPPVEVIKLQGGAPVGGVRELTYARGDQIRITVQLDQPQEDIHIHGYDEEVLNPQSKATFDFKADIEGVFELEAHGPSGDVLLAEIAVEPS